MLTCFINYPDSLFIKSPDDKQQFQQDLDNLSFWSTTSRLPVNSSKSIHISLKLQNFNIICDRILEPTFWAQANFSKKSIENLDNFY